MQPYSLKSRSFFILFITSFCIVAFGQPSFLPYLGPLAAVCGLALFWSLLLQIPSAKRRFWLSTSWYVAVQLVQLSWMLSHPFKYIYIAYPLIALIYGVQWGIVGVFITKERVEKSFFPLFIASLWTLLEWSRLWMLSGSTWNPVGMFLATNSYSLQMASWVGIYGLSFWVTLTNAIVLQLFYEQGRTVYRYLMACFCILFPYLLGVATLIYHHNEKKDPALHSMTLLLVQPAFPIEEWLPQKTAREAIDLAFTEWQQLLTLISPYPTRSIDLIVFPENVVPFGAYAPLFRYDDVQILFSKTLGKQSLTTLPPLKLPSAHVVETDEGAVWVVSHSYILQGIANFMQASVIAGLEDRCVQDGRMCNTTSAFYFQPKQQEPHRYDKRVLVPGEYIPFALASFLKEYGIHDAFTPGRSAKIFPCNNLPIGPSICYEETYGHLMRENRQLGARLLVNLTNDGWYPTSRLSDQHFEHSRLRTIEMGIPLARSTNTGVTASVNSLGEVIDRLEENVPGVLLTTIPLHHYTTLYALAGDWTVLCISVFFLLAYLIFSILQRL